MLLIAGCKPVQGLLFCVAQRCQIHPSLEAQKYIFERKDLKLIRVTVPKESMDMNLLSATASSWLA